MRSFLPQTRGHGDHPERAAVDLPAAAELEVAAGMFRALGDPQRLLLLTRLAGGPVTGPLLLSVGRLSHEKNLESLLPVLDAHPEATLAFVGDGPARAPLERAFAGRHAHFAGFLRGEELATAFASADLFPDALAGHCTAAFLDTVA